MNTKSFGLPYLGSAGSPLDKCQQSDKQHSCPAGVVKDLNLREEGESSNAAVNKKKLGYAKILV